MITLLRDAILIEFVKDDTSLIGNGVCKANLYEKGNSAKVTLGEKPTLTANQEDDANLWNLSKIRVILLIRGQICMADNSRQTSLCDFCATAEKE